MGIRGGSLLGGDQVGVPTQVLIIRRADGPHTRLLDFFVEQMGLTHILDIPSSKRFRTNIYI